MAIVRRSLVAALLGLSLWSCHHRAPQTGWIDPSRAPSPVRLKGSDCLDLYKLPDGWKVASYSTRTWATFGIPGATAREGGLQYDLLVNVGARDYGTGPDDYRDYAEQWVKRAPPQHGLGRHNAALDVLRFEAYPADDGEMVYVGKDVDALMECEVGSWCIVHDGINRHPVALDVSLGYEGRGDAAKKLNFVRHLLIGMKVRC
jgi:hypothetical protein